MIQARSATTDIIQGRLNKKKPSVFVGCCLQKKNERREKRLGLARIPHIL